MSESYLGNCERGSIDVPGLMSLEVLVTTRYGYGTALLRKKPKPRMLEKSSAIMPHSNLICIFSCRAVAVMIL